MSDYDNLAADATRYDPFNLDGLFGASAAACSAPSSMPDAHDMPSHYTVRSAFLPSNTVSLPHFFSMPNIFTPPRVNPFVAFTGPSLPISSGMHMTQPQGGSVAPGVSGSAGWCGSYPATAPPPRTSNAPAFAAFQSGSAAQPGAAAAMPPGSTPAASAPPPPASTMPNTSTNAGVSTGIGAHGAQPFQPASQPVLPFTPQPAVCGGVPGQWTFVPAASAPVVNESFKVNLKHPPFFNGKLSDTIVDIDLYIIDLRRFSLRSRLPFSEVCEQFFQGNARKLLDAWLRANPNLTVDELSNLIRTQFSDLQHGTYRQRARERLHRGELVMKEGDKLSDYAMRAEILFTEAVDLPEIDRINWFVRGLTPTLRGVCATDAFGQEWKSYPAMEDWVYGQEKRQRALSGASKPSTASASTSHSSHLRDIVATAVREALAARDVTSAAATTVRAAGPRTGKSAKPRRPRGTRGGKDRRKHDFPPPPVDPAVPV